MTQPTVQRMLSTTEIVPALRSRRSAAGALLLAGLAYVVAFVCAAVPSSVGFVVAMAAVALAEIGLARRAPLVVWALDRIRFGTVTRSLLRGAVLVLFAARATTVPLAVLTAGAVGLIAVLGGLRAGASQLLGYLREPALLARGLPVDLPRAPAAPARLLRDPGGWAALVEVLAGVGLAVTGSDASPHAAGADSTAIGPVAAGITGVGISSHTAAFTCLLAAVAVSAAAPALLGVHIARLGGLRFRARVATAVERSVADLAPQIVVYFGSGPEWRYQLEMWLRSLESLPQRVLLLVRDADTLRELAATSLPVVAAPGSVTTMQLGLPSVGAVMYVGNAGNNIHLLRRHDCRHIFIGHGDSDKGASSNPFSRVYNEIWVAGAAGRDRYLDAGVDIAPDAFVQVGRPQLRNLPREPDAVPRLTVLYSPTWEGWGDDPHQSSLPHIGPDLVAALLARPELRVMYRPHPRTGHRDPATRRAHEQVLRLMRRAGAFDPGRAPLEPEPIPQALGDALDGLWARTPSALSVSGASPSTSSTPSPRWSRTAQDAAIDQWVQRFWAAAPGHRILTPPSPDLYACFGRTDALIADVSSVTTDFLAADRPYAVLNVTGLPDADFAEQSAAAGGGFVLGRDLAALDDLLNAARGAHDPTESARAAARRYLLGPRTADSAETFRREVARVCTPEHRYTGAAPFRARR